MPVWLKANQSVCTSWEFVVYIVTKRDFTEDYPCYHHHLPDLHVRDDPRQKDFLTVFVGFLSSVYCTSSRTVHTERTNQQPQSVSGARLLRRKVEDLVTNKVPREWVLLDNFQQYQWWATMRKILMTSHQKTEDKPAESLVGAYRAEWTHQWTAGSGITTKIPPLFDGPTSWFRYEELIDDWLDLTVLEA